MVLTGSASPFSGAPGAVIIYALLAVLLWPAAASSSAPFAAARAVGAPSPGRCGSCCGSALPTSPCCPGTGRRRRCTT